MAYTSYIAYMSYMTYTSYIAYTSYMAYMSYMAYTSYFQENTVYNSQLYKIILKFADVTCKGVTFRLAKGAHLDSRAQRYCNKI